MLLSLAAGNGGLNGKLRLRGLLAHDRPAKGKGLECRRPARDEFFLGDRLAVRGDGMENRVLLELEPVDGFPDG